MSGNFRWGDGRDGDIVQSVDGTLTRDSYYNNLEIPAGVTLTTAGYRIFVRNTLTLNGTISRKGNDADRFVAGTALVAGTTGAATAGQTGVTGSGGSMSAQANSFGATGGKGGAGTPGTAGTAGAATVPTAANGGVQILNSGPLAWSSVTIVGGSKYNGGTGGSCGGGDGVRQSGAGGSGGGVAMVLARIITGSGTIDCRGGNGGDATSGNCGGGGGGGGGAIVVCSDTLEADSSITLLTTGGTGGNGIGTGVAGAAGSTGTIKKWIEDLESEFGDGSDSDVTISSNTTLTRDMYYNNLTVNASRTLTTAGYRIFVKDTLNLIGTISRVGTNASGATGGAALSATVLWGGGSGAAGQLAAGAGATAVTNSLCGSGGDSGQGSAGLGAAGATATPPAENLGGLGIMRASPGCYQPLLVGGSTTRMTGGAGGSGGGGDGVGKGGGGGGASTIAMIFAKTIIGSGTITCAGGNGANAVGANAGGGGGGGGGCIVMVSQSDFDTLSITLNVSGGTKGLKTGTGSDGVNGSDGRIYKIRSYA